MAWSARSVDPIILPNGRKLVTPGDAVAYITELPKAEHDADEWQTWSSGVSPLCPSLYTSVRFEIMPSSSTPQTCANTVGPHASHVSPYAVEKSLFLAGRVTLGSSIIGFIVLIVRCGPVVDRRRRWGVRSGLGGRARS